MSIPTLNFRGPGTTKDEQLLRPLLKDALEIVAAEFSSRDGERVLSSTPWVVVWHGHEDLDRKRGRMCVRTADDVTELHVLAPSAHPASSGRFPPEYPEGWHRKNLIHEATAAFMFRYRPAAPLWPLEQGSPGWFREGLQELVAIERSPETVRDDYRRRYSNRAIHQTVQPEFAQVADDYVDGYLILRFMRDEFGLPPIHRVLDRAEQDFWSTLEVAFRTNRSSLYGRWRTWVAINMARGAV